MFFRIYKFIVCSVMPFLWIFFSQGTETLTSYPIKNKEQILEYFLDVIFENSFCSCQGNDGCTRGCRFASHLGRNEYAPVRRCEGKKPVSKSNYNCARHVTGAMMTVIHKFLYFYCNSIGGGTLENIEDYQMCADRFNEDVKNNNVSICRHGFIFPAALCMLNLDGRNFDLYDKISDKGIRSTCKYGDRYNQMLMNVDASLYYGEMTIIPMFRKVSAEKYKEFQIDPTKIPEGAIVVTDSSINLEGHVEVKTNRNECGKSKNQTCFCSDFCRERSPYDQTVLAVFEWNPEFIGHLWILYFGGNFLSK